MSGVEFDEDRIYNQNLINSSMKNKEVGLSNWLVKHKLAKDSKQAQLVLIIISILLIVCSVLLMIANNKQNKTVVNIPNDVFMKLPTSLQEKLK